MGELQITLTLTLPPVVFIVLTYKFCNKKREKC